MKILHTSDLHIGKRVNGISMIEEQKFILDKLLEIAVGENVEALIIAGDIYDKASPSAEAVTVFDSFLSELSAANIRVLAIPGNHDSPERIAFAQELLEKQGVSFTPVYDGEIANVELKDEHGSVFVWLVPFLRPGDVRRFFPESEIGDDYSAALKKALDSCEIDPASRNIAVSHQLITSGGMSPERADEEIKLGGIDNVDVSVFDRFDYVALGHIHRPQRVGRDNVRYSGSPLKYSFSEARYDKSAVLLDLGGKPLGDAIGECASWRLVPLEPLHDMREIRTTLDELLRKGSEKTDGCDDYLHITLTDEQPRLDAMAKIHELYPNAMTLEYENITFKPENALARSTVDPDDVDMERLFARFYEEQVGKPLDDLQAVTVKKKVTEVEEEAIR